MEGGYAHPGRAEDVPCRSPDRRTRMHAGIGSLVGRRQAIAAVRSAPPLDMPQCLCVESA